MFKKFVQSLKRRGLLGTLLKIWEQVAWASKRFMAKACNRNIMRSKYGPVFKTTLNDATFRFYIQGSYGNFLADVLKTHDRPFLFLDIGANQGLYSILAAQNPLCEHVFAFEPVAKTCALLEENIQLNRVAHKISVYKCAISDHAGEKRIFCNPAHTGAASLDHTDGEGMYETIRCITHTELNNLIEGRPNSEIIVKVDTEGHEPVVFGQLRQAQFWPAVQAVFYEVDERWFDNAACFAQLSADGFKEIWRSAGNANHYDVYAQKARG